MTALPVGQYLTELSGEQTRRGGRTAGVSDADALIQDAHARGVAEGRAAIQQEHKTSVLSLTHSFQQKVQAERARWADEQGGHLGSLIAKCFDDIEHRVADVVGDILKPLVSEQVRVRAVAELAQTLDDMLSKGEYAKITISGPGDLLDCMEAKLGGDKPGVTFVAAETADLTVAADETILETRIGAWTEIIREATS